MLPLGWHGSDFLRRGAVAGQLQGRLSATDHACSLAVTVCDRACSDVYKGLQPVNDLGVSLRAARVAAGVSLSVMARRTHYSKALLGLLETGKRTVSPEHVTAYSRALGVPVDALYGSPDDPLRLAHEWLVADTPVATYSAAGRRVGENLVSDLESRVIELRHLDDVVGGGDLWPLVHRELAEVRSVVKAMSYPATIGGRLLTIVAELAQLAGWVASDAGHYAQARQTYLSGVSAARDAGDRVLVGQLLSSLSYQMANVGNPADAALLARSAVAGAESATPRVRALFLERVAWASARSRDSDGTKRALAGVDEAFAHSDGLNEPEWVYWLDHNEIKVMAGRCLIELGKPQAAEPLLAAAIAHYEPRHVREVALYETWLAEAYAKAGTVDVAQTTLAKAREVSTGINSSRLELRFRDVERVMAGS